MVFVTGATGLLGSHLLYFLAVSGHSVSALRRKQSRLEDSRAVFLQYPDGEKYWNTIILDGTIPEKDIKKMIKESYDIITDSPTKRIYEAVKQIPKGHVATYGQVAAMAGNPKMSRAVGNALHKNPDPENIPCFRVVNAKGELAGAFAFGGEGNQAKLLEEDGVVVVDGKVDLDVYGM